MILSTYIFTKVFIPSIILLIFNNNLIYSLIIIIISILYYNISTWLILILTYLIAYI